MAQFESSVKYVPYSQERVFNKLSDLSSLESVREKLTDPKLAEKVQDLKADRDSLSITVQGISLTLRIIEREPYKCIKFEGENSPIPMNLWIQMLPVDADQAKLKVTLRAEVNMFMKAMVNKPLQDGVEKLAEMLSMIPY